MVELEMGPKIEEKAEMQKATVAGERTLALAGEIAELLRGESDPPLIMTALTLAAAEVTVQRTMPSGDEALVATFEKQLRRTIRVLREENGETSGLRAELEAIG